jgi:aminoglycoside phosphotransferase (APT) family kinase protein
MSKVDGETDRKVIGEWLARRIPAARFLKIEEWEKPKVGNSAETIFVTAAFQQEGVLNRERLVLRRQMEGTDLALDADLGREFALLQALARHPRTRAPAVFGLETDRGVLGSPFYMMERIDGRTVQQYPNYNEEGWLADASPALRSRVWKNAIEAVAEIHKIDWVDGLRFLDDPKRGQPGLAQYLRHLEDWYVWAAQGREQPVGDAALAWLKTNMPAQTSLGVVWGDAIPANMIFASDGRVAGVIDWELAGLGPGEIDLGWWLFFDRLFSEGFGVERLAGLPDRAETIAIYEAAAGRMVVDIDYFEVLAMVRLGIIGVRQFDRQVSFGRIPPTSKAYLHNPMMAMIARKLDLPVPEVGADYAALLSAKKAH